LLKNGYSDTQIGEYHEVLARFRLRFHPKDQLAPDPVEHYITARDGSNIFVQEFIPAHPKAVVIGQPGNSCQGDLYFPLADHLYFKDIGLIAADNRGHGRSGPARGRFDHPEQMFSVYDALVDKFKDMPVHLLGESLGTTMFAAYLAAGSEASMRVSSVIFLVPPYNLRRHWVLGPARYLIKLVLGILRVFTWDRAFLSFKPDLRPTYFPEYHEIDVVDPIRAPKSTAVHLLNLIRQIERFHADAAAITIPLLVLAGTGDKDLEPPTDIAKRSRGTTVKIFENADHSLMFDKNSQGSFDIISSWLEGGWQA